MKPLLTPIPVLFAGVLCTTQTNEFSQSTKDSNLIDDAFIRDHEGVNDALITQEHDRTVSAQDRKYVSCTKLPLEINY